MYRAHPSWFLDIQGQKNEMLAANESTSWTPKQIQEGRFKHILETAPDWNLSRDRYWATPIPVWRGVKNDGTEVIKVIGSYDEFEELTGKKLDDYHLPNVMDVEFELDGAKMRHIGKVLDCWFESGSMPFAQFHYPFENKAKFESAFPADFIIEAIDPTRGWFYALTAVNVGLFGKAPFNNLICTGHITASDGKKLSKKLGNYTDPIELMDTYSADSFRFLMLTSPLTNGENFGLADRDVSDVARKLSMLWNMYDFFTMYAEVDNWEWKGDLTDPSKNLENPLDIWVVSRLHKLINEVTGHMQSYDIPQATRPILAFIDDASNWYVRRSRRRFWKSDSDSDKENAYRTLHYVLTKMSMLLAPFTPFLTEELYQKLTGDESVHLVDWPLAGEINNEVLEEMEVARDYVNQALSIRSKNSLKIRQPLSKITVPTIGKSVDYEDILKDELNVKTVEKGAEVSLDLEVTPELKREGILREVIRHVQNSRKEAGLNVDDRINLSISSDDAEVMMSVKEHSEILKHETLAKTLDFETKFSYEAVVKIDNSEIKITLEKTK
jgi:isoleucyl-tRNA synthetase